MVPASSLETGVGTVRFDVDVSRLFILPVSTLSPSTFLPASAFSFPPTPTLVLNRLYKLVRPFCTNSPVMLAFSVEEGGGGANSLKVVRVSDWDAVV